MLGTEQQRALKQAASMAIKQTARELHLQADEEVSHLAMVIDQVFSEPVPARPVAEYPTLLQALQVGVATQLAVLGDASLTGTGRSSADLLGMSVESLTEKLTGHLLREIVDRGAGNGPLAALANQLNHDVTYLQNQHTHGMIERLIREVMASLTGAQRHIDTSPAELEYGRVLDPVIPAIREFHNPETGAMSAHRDASILVYLTEEFVRLGAIDIAVAKGAYQNVLHRLPTAFSRRIVEVDYEASKTAATRVIQPIADEHGFEVTHNGSVLSAPPGSPKGLLQSLGNINAYLSIFIQGMQYGLQVDINVSEMRSSVNRLLEASRSLESRGNLITIGQVLLTYRPRRVGAVTMTSVAPSRLIDIFLDLVNDPLYQELSHNIRTMGLVGQSSTSTSAVTQAAMRLASQEAGLRFGRRQTLVPSEQLLLSGSAVSEIFNGSYFPPIVSMDHAIDRARRRWKQEAPDFIPVYDSTGPEPGMVPGKSATDI